MLSYKKTYNVHPSLEVNPYKHVSVLDTNCGLKAGMVTIGGGAMGFVMALFMNAMEFREMDFTKGAKQTTKANMKKDFYRMLSMSKGFAIFGFFFSIWECQSEKLRLKDDAINSFYAGALTSSILAIGTGVGYKAMAWTFGGGGVFGIAMYKMNYLFTGHS